MLAPASGTLTSWTDGKSARKTYIQLILGKKLEKFVLTTQNCAVCMCQRGDISLATPGRAGLGKAGCLRRLRVPLASLLPAGGPEAAAPHYGGEGWALAPSGWEIFSSMVTKGFIFHFFSSTFQPTRLPPSALVCFSANIWARELMSCVFPGRTTCTFSEMTFRQIKVKI